MVKFRDNKKIGLQRSLNQKGQALVEYVLLVIVVISVAMALMKIFFEPYRNFSSNFFGEYLMCVLETAELPGVNEETPSGECENSFSGKGGKTAGKKGSGTKGKDGEDGEGGASSDGEAGDNGSVAGTGGKGRAGKGGGRTTQNGGRRTILMNSSEPGSVGESTLASENKEEGGKSPSAGGFAVGRAGRTRIIRIKAKGFGGYVEQEREKKKKEEQKIQKVGVAGKEDIFGANNKKLRVKEAVRKSKLQEEQIEELNLGKWLRFILIAGILIALLLFLFMQFNSISKSWEK